MIQTQKRVRDFIPLVEMLTEKQVNYTLDIIVGNHYEYPELKLALKDYIDKGIVFLRGMIAPTQMDPLYQLRYFCANI